MVVKTAFEGELVGVGDDDDHVPSLWVTFDGDASPDGLKIQFPSREHVIRMACSMRSRVRVTLEVLDDEGATGG